MQQENYGKWYSKKKKDKRMHIAYYLIFGIQSDVQIKDLGDATIFAENLGTTKLYHETWKFILGIHTLNFETQFSQKLCDQCQEQFELKCSKNRLNWLETSKFLLHQISQPSRIRWGLINAFRSISKILFGTLDNHDLEIINQEFEKIYKDNKVMAETIGNRTRLIENLLNSASHDLQTLNEQSKGHIEGLNQIINVTNSNQKIIVTSN